MTKIEMLKKVKIKTDRAGSRYRTSFYQDVSCSVHMERWFFWRRIYNRLKAEIDEAQELRG